MSTPDSVLVIGAGAAGLSTVEALRRKGYAGRITVLGGEPHPPYDRPPLSKQVLAGTWTGEQSHLRSRGALDMLNAEFLLGDRAIGLDAPRRTVRTASGRILTATAVVITTGVRARTLPGQNGITGVHTLRSLDDAAALRASLLAAPRAVVVGDGVLGAEIAATARAMGSAVTLTGPQPTLMAARLGALVASELAALHREAGVQLRPGTAVTGLDAEVGRVTGVRLDSGEVLPAQVVVVAVGSVPETDWLTGSGLVLRDGVVCDSHGQAADGIFAAGDVARWTDPDAPSTPRLENRTNAADQAAALADGILGTPRRPTPVPYFWTDQFTARIHVHGRPAPDAEVSIVEGALTDRRFVAHYREQGRTTAVLGWNMPKQARRHRQALLPLHRAAVTHTSTD